MKRAAILVFAAVAMLTVAGAAVGAQIRRCGLVSYRGVYKGQSYTAHDAVVVVRGTTSCTVARHVDRRADEGHATAGWICAFSRRGTLTTCLTLSGRSAIEGKESGRPSVVAAPPPASAPTPAPAPIPVPISPPAPVPTPPAPAPSPTPVPAPVGCYPLSNEGTCYEPGEYCRDADIGTSGVAGDGEAITCEYNNGWRWEPS